MRLLQNKNIMIITLSVLKLFTNMCINIVKLITISANYHDTARLLLLTIIVTQ